LYTPNARGIVEPLQRLLEAARRHGVAVIYVRHVFAADGSDVGRMADFDDTPSLIEGTPHAEIVQELASLPGEPVVRAASSDDCRSALSGRSVRALLPDPGSQARSELVIRPRLQAVMDP
jgi:nicotinamidase-related amidase